MTLKAKLDKVVNLKAEIAKTTSLSARMDKVTSLRCRLDETAQLSASMDKVTSLRAEFGPGFVSATPYADSLAITSAPSEVDAEENFNVEVTVYNQFGDGFEGAEVDLTSDPAAVSEIETTDAEGVALFESVSIEDDGDYTLTATHDELADIHEVTVNPVIPQEGLVLHLDADAIEGLSDNDTVTTWDDLSGEENDTTAGGAPTYKTDVLNGLSVVRLDGIDDYFETEDTQVVPKTGDFTAIGVLKLSAGITDHHALIGTGTTTSGEFNFYATSTAGTADNEIRVWLRGDGEILTGSDIRGAGGKLAVFTRDGTAATLWLDGEVDGEGTSSEDVASKVRVGAATDSGDVTRFFLDGDIAEVLIYDRALTTEEHEDVKQYLADKWGIELAGGD